MKNTEIKILMAAIAGIIGGIVLGMFLFSPDQEEKREEFMKRWGSLKERAKKAEKEGKESLDGIKSSLKELLADIQDTIKSKDSGESVQ